jgi:Putative peptidoglycan binding domain/Caspase domain
MKHTLDTRALARGLGLSLLLAGLPSAGPHAATQGAALVIGSDANTGETGCEKTASAVGDRLRDLGFAVKLLLRPTVIALRSALDDFAADEESQPPGAALIYACAGAVGEGSRLFVLPFDPEPGHPLQPQTQGVLLQALLNALAGTGGTLYADLTVPKGSASNSFTERLPDGLHLALAVSSDGNPGVIGNHLAGPGARVDQGWPEIADALKPLAGAAALTVLPLPAPLPAAPPPTVVAASPPATPAPASSPSSVADQAEAPAPETTAVAPPGASLPAPPGLPSESAATAETPAASAPAPKPTPALSPEPASTPTEKTGSHTAPVKHNAGTDTQPASGRTARVQAALARRNLYRGPIDGLMGPNTILAIRTFQRSLGSEPTGVLSRLEIVRLLNP